MDMEWMNYVLVILSGMATAIPLIVKLIQFAVDNVKAKRWAPMMDLVMELMETAEQKFKDGATRKEWVLAMAAAAADELDCEFDAEVIGKMIDQMCAMSKVVNAPADAA